MDPLKGKVSVWKQMLHRWQARRDIPFRKKYFVGYDLEGNSYWEFFIDSNSQRLRRKIEHRIRQNHKVDYFQSIPPQWLQWLRFTRQHYPTLTELIEDQRRQQKMKILAKQADEKWKSEKVRLEEEHQQKLNEQLKQSEQKNQSAPFQNKAQETEDPFEKARKNETPIESAAIKPRR